MSHERHEREKTYAKIPAGIYYFENLKGLIVLLYLVPGYRSLEWDISVARQKALEESYNKPVFVGFVNFYDPEELLEINAKVMVRENRIYLIECPLDLHEFCANEIAGEIAWNLSKAIIFDERLVNQGCQGTFKGFVNKFMCGTSGIGKLPDDAIYLKIPRPMISRPVIFEVSFRNEKLRELLIEGASWVNQHTDTDICVLLEVTENKQKTNVDFFGLYVFRRVSPFWSDVTPKPTITCIKDWSCSEISEELRNLDPMDLSELFHVEVLAHYPFISRKTLALGQKIIVNLPTDGLNKHCRPLKPFSDSILAIDMTNSVSSMFTTINSMVDNKTYPNIG